MDHLVTAVLSLRKALGDTQQAFATRLGLSMRAIANYESGRAPTGKALAQMMNLAHSRGLDSLARAFQDAISGELGYRVPRVGAAKTVDLLAGEEQDIDALLTILRSPRYADELKKWQKISKPVKEANAAKDFRASRDFGLFLEIQRRIREQQSDEEIASALKLSPESVEAVRSAEFRQEKNK